jgi:hypothetical protein
MPTIDEPMRFDNDKTCQRCGHAKSYHKMKVDGKAYIKCIRKKPYKLADGVDVKLGMQVWNFHPYDDDFRIITGMVRFISSCGGLCLWRYPDDREPRSYTLEDGRVIELPGRLSHDGHLTAKFHCYSSLENAQAAVEKRKKEKARLEAWIEKDKISRLES